MKKETIISRVLMVVALFITFYFKELFPKLWLLFTLITALILGIYVSYRVKIKDKNSKK
ncbi:hypothetical protein [Lactococcus cremoris]|uniref:Uncharacterized protein n=3 Tax=Lactococcus lactis subsp. cremoris TaxID=1359 RepID=T0SEZ4_LACLC|nr:MULTISPECIES: hypothetical protein [Lactococcus]EQC55113.1 hypothetical protein LLT5_05570 [Lactococcus cremoris subsp. cremoris TIFN5]EQC57011.1 hypothetical protein LLT6_12595 [Lactococcus cremoris subsp. cremoris TIFN6]EQC83525.1 hypothetical protein LLT7_14755 [Lactococcus cremoris subsp. cremoris TIFN7]EQC88744.1 hypothetical protein LLT1_04260 [Lactococcus cremoris subsp. cremoris TIFN1]EQC96041.1 hypothetical protein LLT3_12005 [Lactococcus cremoris subsp. cremoris TIFN3]